MEQRLKAKLVLEDGSVFPGYSFGFAGNSSGEVVFNTAMNGYPESLTDPSYYGQILVTTFPLIGNYGVPEPKLDNGVEQNWESNSIHIRGLVVNEYSISYSHWNANKSLGQWLTENGIPGISGVDTRMLTKHLREKGCMLGKIVVDGDIDWYNPNSDNLVEKVSVSEPKVYGNAERKIVLVDCGVKNNIIRCLLKRNIQVLRVPYNYNFLSDDFDGVLISNGPGDPKLNKTTISNIRAVLGLNKPIMGICLGNQLLALAANANTYKLSYGHRGHNQPVRLKGTNRCFITSQNHGYAIDASTLSDEWEVMFENLNDGTCEGIRHRSKPFFAVQFHPEASGGPNDTEFLFDEFINLIDQN
jgi:carbamoyl-phosphate synthase small subunit